MADVFENFNHVIIPSMVKRIWLTRAELEKIWCVAHQREAAKTTRNDRHIKSRFGWEPKWDGLRGELATAKFFGIPEQVNYNVGIAGDGGTDLRYHGYDLQIKLSTYLPPYLRFEETGPKSFTADIAILTHAPIKPEEYDPLWLETNGWVDIWGWVSKAEFLSKAKKTNLGTGEILVMKPPLHPIDELENEIMLGLIMRQ